MGGNASNDWTDGSHAVVVGSSCTANAESIKVCERYRILNA